MAPPPATEHPIAPPCESVGATSEAVVAAASPHDPELGTPSTLVAPLTQAFGVPAVIAAAAAAAARSCPLLPSAGIIRPVIMRPVVVTSSAPAPQIIRPTIHGQALSGQAVAVSAPASSSAAPTPLDMSSALAAVQRARRMADESRAKKQSESEESECIVCFGRLKSAVRLKPCGHMQMCSLCCKKLIAIAESKRAKLEVRL